jgi:CHASE2 domain-containing sensor protein
MINRRKYFIIGVVLLMIVGVVYFLRPRTIKSESPPIDSLVKLTDQIDPDIVLVNIGEGDRAFIGNLLRKIDSCKPNLIAIDAWFVKEKEPIQDSVLMNALKVIKNDVLAYTIDSNGVIIKSHSKFRSLALDEGLAVLKGVDGITNSFTPILASDSQTYEHFALQIIKHWNPSFKLDLKKNESIPIKFNRTLEQFAHFNESQLESSCNELKNKIVLLGYIGPNNEDKHFTPIRYVKKYDIQEPDTYGLVIIANEIRTLLEYEKKN